MKKTLLSIFAIIISTLGFSQVESIAIVSIPNQIEVGTTGILEFTYTSDVAVNFTVSLFKTKESLLEVNYTGTWQKDTTITNLPAGTDLPVTVRFTIPGNVSPSSSLPTGVQYTFDVKMTYVSTTNTDFGWSNGTADHTVEILPSSIPVDNIDFTAATAASVDPGAVLSVPFSYTLSTARNVKAGLAIYTSSRNYVSNASVNGTEVAVYYNNEPATTTTPVPQTASITIPSTLTPSSLLPAGQVYKVVVSIFTTSWGYISDKKNDIVVNTMVVDNINFTGPTPSTVDPGTDISVPFEYTLSEERNVKVGLAIYDGSGVYVSNATVGGTEVATYYSNEPATTLTAVQKSATVAIPAGLTPSALLPSGQVYKVVISIFTTTWTHIIDMKNDITVNDLTAGLFPKVDKSKLSVFPNPATDLVTISYPGKIESVNVYNASGSNIEVEANNFNGGELQINTSSLKSGIYILKVSTNEGVASEMLVK